MTVEQFIAAQLERSHRLSRRRDWVGLTRAAMRLIRMGRELPRCWFRIEVGYIAENMMRLAIAYKNREVSQ